MKVKKTVTSNQRLNVKPNPCPFCPAEDEDNFIVEDDQVFCRACGAKGPYGSGATIAVQMWNGFDRDRLGINIERPCIAEFQEKYKKDPS